MADKEFLERMLSMLPEEFQDIYDDTIPEAKEVVATTHERCCYRCCHEEWI